MNDSAMGDSPPDASAKRFSSPRNSDMWVCMPDPCTPLSGLGMNVAHTPASSAIFRTTRRSVMMLSAIDSASLYCRSISCWLGLSSWKEYSTGMPNASSMCSVRRRRSLATSAVVRSKYDARSSGFGSWDGSPSAK